MSINDFRLYGGKAQGVIDVSAPPDEEVVEEVEPQVEEETAPAAPTSANLKAEIYDYLLSQGYEQVDLIGLTKAELLELV